MDSVCSDRGLLCRVSPFRHPRLNGYLLLPAAFRSLSRLSSALSAKASTLCSFLLDLRALSGTRQPYSVTLTVFSLSALSFPFQRLTPDEIESNLFHFTGLRRQPRTRGKPLVHVRRLMPSVSVSHPEASSRLSAFHIRRNPCGLLGYLMSFLLRYAVFKVQSPVVSHRWR